MKRQRQRGFTLLEVLVVVALVALVSAILVPSLSQAVNLTSSNTSDRLVSTINELAEKSVFSGQITALHIGDKGYQPLHYSPAAGAFQPFNTATLKQTLLPANARLDWAAAKQMQQQSSIQSGITRHASQGVGDDAADKETDISMPQILFMPSGQATDGILTLTTDAGKVRLRINPMGRVKRLTQQSPNEPAKPPLLLPRNANVLAQQGGR